MSDTGGRRPGAFRVEPEPTGRAETQTGVRAPRSISDLAQVAIEPDEDLEAQAAEALEPAPARLVERSSRFSFARLALGALGALVSLSIGLALDALVRDLFARAEWLGWLALVLSLALLFGVLGVATREIRGILRLATVERERRDGQRAFETDDHRLASDVVDRLSALLAARPETARGRRTLADTAGEVVDGRDLVLLAERELLLPVDRRARALVLASAKRVSIVTAVSPRALVDLLFVVFETVRLVRAVSELYGARPGTIGLVRLVRDVLAHLAVTGSIAVGDSLVQQVVGHGLATRLSAKLGEGVVNGLLTARVGLAAMDLCRPLPFLGVSRPRMGDFVRDLTLSQPKAE